MRHDVYLTYTYCPMRTRIHSGEIYIGVVISIGIFIMLSQAVVLLSNTGYELIGFTRARNAARTLALTKMEYARNLPYDSVGTVGGIPSGTIAQNETISLNGQQYVVQTTVLYVDDPFDGVSPIDTVPNDYKRVRIEVTWAGLGPRSTKSVLVSDIAPKGVEKVTGGGTLSFLVFDSTGTPVSNASVTIASSGLTPPVNQSLTTNDNGRIVVPGAPACVKCYRVTVTKSGMSTDRTYGANEVANPAKPDLTVTVGGLTDMSFTIDNLATLTISTVGEKSLGFPSLPSQSLLLIGQKIIGTDTLDNPVYKYSQAVTTDSGGTLTLSNMEWDIYTIQPATASARVVSGTNPLVPLLLSPSATTNIAVSLSPRTTHSLLAAFVDASRNPIASVAATLIDNGTPIATISGGLNSDPDYGQGFFSGLSAKTYTIEASASGFQPISNPVSVNGTDYDELILNP